MKVLEGKVALVTGGGSGIGREIAYEYAVKGAKVVVSDLNEKGGNETVLQIAAGGGVAKFILSDTSKPADCLELVGQTKKHFGGLHIACNNAGIAGPIMPVGEYPIDGWDKVISVNLSGVFYGMRYQIPALLESGGGVIVNISSILGQVGFGNSAAYAASKHGIIGLTQSAALEYAQRNIRVNAVCPAFIITPMVTDNINEQGLKAVAGLHPLGRLGKPSEVAGLVVWLSSDSASFVTGSAYNVDGGYLAQ